MTTAEDLTPAEDSSELDKLVEEASGDRKTASKERRALLIKSPAFVIGALIVGFWVFCALFPGVLTRFDPIQTIPADQVTSQEVAFTGRLSPDSQFWMGTDTNGRDVYSRVIAGARPIMVDSAVAAVVAIIAGTFIGLVMGYKRGWIDEVLSRIVEAFLSLPVILIALLATANLGESRLVITTIVAVLFMPIVARTVRAAVIAEADLDYVESSRLRGESSLFIMIREILPNVTGTIVVELTVRFAYAIFTLATLAFLGFAGGDLAQPGWGKDIASEFDELKNNRWWASIFPALAIGSLVVGVNLIADTIDKVTKE